MIEPYNQYASTFCNGCDGTCQEAAGTEVPLGDVARYLSYYEMDGRHREAKELYRMLPAEQRNWKYAGLSDATKACCRSLPFAQIMKRAEEKLA